jgi:hypothetical protein
MTSPTPTSASSIGGETPSKVSALCEPSQQATFNTTSTITSHPQHDSIPTLPSLAKFPYGCPARLYIPDHPKSLCSRAEPMWTAIANPSCDISDLPLADQGLVQKQREVHLDPWDPSRTEAIQYHLRRQWEAAETLMSSACIQKAGEKNVEACQLGSRFIEESLSSPEPTPEEARTSKMIASLEFVGKRCPEE